MVEEIPKVGDTGLELISYPEEAIHEIITNALLLGLIKIVPGKSRIDAKWCKV
ncbi:MULTISPECIES: hypothetical protein [unclassified Nostoc]|uniref:hypothetical protein n=1 Tax=unclassified Nostoc TaxID=2593658 RepID=UPI0013D3BC8E|nr:MULTISPECIES: hypothetical protein [unclassified Nostoc]MBE8999299.1 hypothetical protein [Nostoc sp. LEGE 12447]NEU81996.1 hypothetical protein [Nostoc sp. UIC 10630]